MKKVNIPFHSDQKLKTKCGSPCYASPEMIESQQRYDPVAVDVWSTGVVLFAMLAGYLPFCDPDT
jgi:5'-AMP-activated protein kinase catalytic alpha subunit